MPCARSGRGLASIPADASQEPHDDRNDEQHDTYPEEEVHCLHEATNKSEDNRDYDECYKYAVHG